MFYGKRACSKQIQLLLAPVVGRISILRSKISCCCFRCELKIAKWMCRSSLGYPASTRWNFNEENSLINSCEGIWAFHNEIPIFRYVLWSYDERRFFLCCICTGMLSSSLFLLPADAIVTSTLPFKSHVNDLIETFQQGFRHFFDFF